MHFCLTPSVQQRSGCWCSGWASSHYVRPWGKGNPSQKPKVSSFYEIKGTEPVPGPLAKCWTVAWTLFPSTVLFLRSHQVVADDSCFTYSSCLFPLLDLQIFSTLMFVPGFDKALRCLTCVGNFFFFFPEGLLRKKKKKERKWQYSKTIFYSISGWIAPAASKVTLRGFPFTAKSH